MDIQKIIDELVERIDNANNWDNYEAAFALVNFYEWIKENSK